jgi:4-hydroxythreonine-4-phosphate dehydrogenase
MTEKPVIGILLGDSSGIGPELVAKTAASGFLTSMCRPVIIGDNRIFEAALRLIGKTAVHYCISDVEQAGWTKGLPVLDQKDQDPAKIPTGQLNAECGRAVLNMLRVACNLCLQKKIAGFCFAPLNKAACIEAKAGFESDENEFMGRIFNLSKGFSEINVLGNLSTTRTTSHVPIKEVSNLLTIERIVDSITLAHKTVRSFGVETPRLGVAALNPHSGENGLCGREEIDIIAPAIKKAKDAGLNALGPISADVLFVKAFAGEFDCAVTMYHDQGQIAMKLKGFEKGVTVSGGMPYPIATPAHGTAFDIAGKGTAKTSAFESSLALAVRMAVSRKE